MHEPGIPDHLTPLIMAKPQLEDGRWRSDQHEDGYRGGGGARDEISSVFHEACGLNDQFRAPLSVIAELGFGSGLSILETIRLFREVSSSTARLCLVSCEQFPMDASAAKAMLSHDGAAPDLVSELIDQWPMAIGGWHRLSFLGGRVHLTLGLGDAAHLLPTLDFEADAWFLDGFSPAKNPEMWTPELLRLVTERSAPDAKLGTWCSAGEMRRTLSSLGWCVERISGFSNKRHRVQAHRTGAGHDRSAPQKVKISGAGFAGAGAARAFAERGWSVQIYDPNGPASAASGNPRSLVQPRLAKGVDAASHLHLHAALFAARQMDQLGLQTTSGALHLPVGHHAAKVSTALGHQGLPEEFLQTLSASEASNILGFPVGAGAWFPSARTVSGPEYVSAMLDHPNIELSQKVAPDSTPDGTPMVWCTGSSAGSGLSIPGIHQIRGQLEILEPIPQVNHAICFGHYLLPAHDAMVLGASYDHDDNDSSVRENTAEASLMVARSALPNLPLRRLGGRTSFRLASRDRLPLVGVDSSATHWMSLAHGSRGASTGPFLGAYLADLMEGVPTLLPTAYCRRLQPSRFIP